MTERLHWHGNVMAYFIAFGITRKGKTAVPGETCPTQDTELNCKSFIFAIWYSIFVKMSICKF